ncbi:hypothetical protein Lser_V15G37718 [Lactuca serriola]
MKIGCLCEELDWTAHSHPRFWFLLFCKSTLLILWDITVLANRIAWVIGSIVNIEQSAFVKGHQILDRPLIQACLNLVKASVLVIESLYQEFCIKRGLGQCDPLSSYLFIIVMEGLHVALEDVNFADLLSGVVVGPNNLILSYLFYVDDVLLLGEWSKRNTKNMIMMLNYFYLVSRLKMNLHKSNLYGVGVQPDEVVEMATITGCASGKLLFLYLGLLVIENMARVRSRQRLFD